MTFLRCKVNMLKSMSHKDSRQARLAKTRINPTRSHFICSTFFLKEMNASLTLVLLFPPLRLKSDCLDHALSEQGTHIPATHYFKPKICSVQMKLTAVREPSLQLSPVLSAGESPQPLPPSVQEIYTRAWLLPSHLQASHFTQFQPGDISRAESQQVKQEGPSSWLRVLSQNQQV